MYLKVLRGLEEAKRELSRVDPLDLDSLPPEVMERTEALFGERLKPQESVQRILDDVRRQGDTALRHYTRLLDGFSPAEEMEVNGEQISQSRQMVPEALANALGLAARRIEDFHRSILRKSWIDLSSGLGELVVPLEAGRDLRARRNRFLSVDGTHDGHTRQGGRRRGDSACNTSPRRRSP